MSDAGLFSSVYQQFHEYADLVDEVLAGLKDGTSMADDTPRQELAQLLIDLAQERYDDPSTRLIVLLLRGKENVSRLELQKLGNALLSVEADESIIEPLERFAQALEQEQVMAIAKMQGWDS